MKQKSDKLTQELPQLYPQWVCVDCGTKHGNRPCGVATVHEDICGVCGKLTSVTEPRDFGHLKGFK